MNLFELSGANEDVVPSSSSSQEVRNNTLANERKVLPPEPSRTRKGQVYPDGLFGLLAQTYSTEAVMITLIPYRQGLKLYAPFGDTFRTFLTPPLRYNFPKL